MAEPLTVGLLKKVLETMPDDTRIGVVGHFGEFRQMGTFDVRAQGVAREAKQDSWMGHVIEMERVLSINTPDIGPDPD